MNRRVTRTAPEFAYCINTWDGVTGDREPEGLTVITAKSSLGGQPLLVAGNGTSGTTAIYRIHLRY